MAASRPLPPTWSSAREEISSSCVGAGCDNWPYLDQAVLRASRSRKVCMTCHWFRHQASVSCIPLPTCQLHQGLITHGEHLTRRCQGWTDAMHRQQGWAPEVA
ncbi:MAG: galactose oxidase [Vulcanococcus sp.]